MYMGERMEYGGFFKRLVAAIIDGIILAIVGFIVGLVLDNMALENLISIVIGFLYFALQESSPRQATLGKQVMGIYVTDMNGNRISMVQATIRYFAKYLSALILFIGFIMAAFTEKKQGLHDIIAKTLVLSR